MIRTTCCVALLLLSVVSSPLFAQEKPKEKVAIAPEVHIVIPSTNAFIEDLEYIINMTSKPKQIKVLKDYIQDVYLIGVDFTRPIRLDILLNKETYRKRIYLPIPTKGDLKTFRSENLAGFNIKTRLIRRSKYLYRLRDAAKITVGWMRWRDKYTVIGEKREDVSLKLPKPLAEVAELLKLNYDVAIEGKNTPNGIEERHTQFSGTRKELLAALKRNEKKKETEDDFALRKMLFTQQLNELERIYAEAEHLLIGWTTDSKKKQGELNLTLKPLSGTELEKSLKLLGTKPSYFVNIPKAKTSILSARINFALDEMRKKHILETNKTLRKREKTKVDLLKEASKESKTNQKKAWDLYFDMINATVKTGLVDTFIDVHPSTKNGKQTMIGGIQSADGTALIPQLELFGKIHPDTKPELNTTTIGEVKIHKIQIVKSRHPEFVELFGSETLLLGTSKNAIWYAAGENALEELKTAINLVTQPKKEEEEKKDKENKKEEEKKVSKETSLVDIQVKLNRWIKLIDQKRNHQADKTKASSQLRKFALMAFANGQDDLSFQLNRVDDHVTGKLVVLPGVLRFVGEIIADFSKEKLAEE
ncbi:hypothetical protein MNBD_PLANCTO02-630 [hydrothermal vent metagenome]|uniref:Uncharacterized protein n=1 Tax=hydrothermal vent metagenome TaxID=652676 RepID=A0A3B1DBG3_9ZZZZ